MLARLCEQPSGRKYTRLYGDQLNSQLHLLRGTGALCWHKGQRTWKGLSVASPYVQKQSSWIERKCSGELSKQNLAKTFVFSPSPISFQLFTQKNHTGGKGSGVKKK